MAATTGSVIGQSFVRLGTFVRCGVLLGGRYALCMQKLRNFFDDLFPPVICFLGLRSSSLATSTLTCSAVSLALT